MDPRVLSIQSHVVSGYVGNKSAVFPLQSLGFDVDPINSVQFSNHTGYPNKWKGEVLQGDKLWDLVDGLDANDLLNYTHVLTGYIGSVTFLETVLRTVERIREKNPDLMYVCDPVLGDEGKLYVPDELVPIYRERVVSAATIITPNQFECELLTGVKIASEEDAAKACDILHGKGVKIVAITSLYLKGQDFVTMFVSSNKNESKARYKLEAPLLPQHFTGTGDLTAALLLAWSWRHPDDIKAVLEKTLAGVQGVLRTTVECGSKELKLIQSRDAIENPLVNIRAEEVSF